MPDPLQPSILNSIKGWVILSWIMLGVSVGVLVIMLIGEANSICQAFDDSEGAGLDVRSWWSWLPPGRVCAYDLEFITHTDWPSWGRLLLLGPLLGWLVINVALTAEVASFQPQRRPRLHPGPAQPDTQESFSTTRADSNDVSRGQSAAQENSAGEPGDRSRGQI